MHNNLPFSSRLRALILFFTLLLLTTTSCLHEEPIRYSIGVSQCSDDAWRTKLNEEMQRELLFHPGIALEVRSADNDNERQAADIDYFIRNKVNLLIVSPNQADKLTPAVSRAFDAGIPVIVADRRVTGQKYTAFVGGDNLAVGELMAKYLLMTLPEGGKVLEVLGLKGSTPAELRHEGFMAGLGDRANLYEVIQCEGDFLPEAAARAAEPVLREHGDIQIVLAQNDLMAIAVHDVAKRLYPDQDIIYVGVDGLTGEGNGVEAIVNGVLDASAVYATGGDLIIQTAVKILEGQPFDRDIELATYLIDPATAPLMNNIYKEVNHEIATVTMLKGKVDEFWLQHNLEQSLLYTLAAMLILVSAFVFVLVYYYNKTKRLNLSLADQKEKVEEQRDQLAQQNDQLKQLTQQVEEATKAKLMFFTNVSHDFRTPLTLISGPLEQLLQSSELSRKSQEWTRLAHKNVQVLLRLVNQILDFRKYESGKLELNLSNIDMRETVKGWFDSFEGLAHKKHIKLELKLGQEQADKVPDAFLTKADLAKVERIFFNLMGNAFKFTPENGRITVSLARQEQNIVMKISDTGPGISVEHIQHIFENFYQVDSAHHEGSGIGLALVKSFVELHKGTIAVNNQTEGTGSIFTVTLPVVAVDPNESPSVDHALMSQLSQQAEMEFGDVIEDEEISEDEPKPIVLVIDDNSDIRGYMTTLLSDQYRVLTAAKGQEGIRKAMRVMPNVIICDVMMPGMDGIECCRRLKGEVNTSHIPVLMLTACSLDEQRVQGLTEGGADAYMAKPFNANVLLAQLDSLVKNRERIHSYFAENVTHPAATVLAKGQEQASSTATRPAIEPASLDDKFLQKIRSIIDENLADAEFGVEQLGDQIGMSRAQLYRKVKAITNYSPVELIRNTRLKRAQQMLAQGDDNISQVAYQVGFTAPSYFTKCYKDYFGENPNELVKRKVGQ